MTHPAPVPATPPQPFVDDSDFQLYVGDALDVLRTLPDESVHCCITSPPYWGLRSYLAEGHDDKPLELGAENTPEEYVARMVEVFREVRRVLRRDGTCWLNIGDSYNAARDGGHAGGKAAMNTGRDIDAIYQGRSGANVAGLKAKDLVGIPWRVAFALQADGWYLRSEIIWAKPNPMPESVTDRPTKSHEQVFLLTRSPRYYFDQEAVREQFSEVSLRDPRLYNDGATRKRNSDGRTDGYTVASGTVGNPERGRNLRSVWEIATQPYSEAHFATFPEALPERCIKAGCPEYVCGTCGEPRERIVLQGEAEQHRNRWGNKSASQFNGDDGAYQSSPTLGRERERTTLGWSDCGHDNYQPGVVLDPFAGSGTVALVARKLGRRSIGIELNPEYAELATRRLQQLSLLA